jgi:7-cyano-7-deazaguanine synthase
MVNGAESSSAVVLLSGGMDSSVLLHHVARELRRTPVHAISFDYGQRHHKELECASWQAKAAGATVHQIVDMAFLGDLIKGGTSLVTGGAEVPDLAALPKNALDQPPTYVPNRNMILLSLAAAYAEAHRIRDVFYGAQAHDEYGYWDCTRDFLARINATLALNRRDAVTIHAPFIGQRKAELVRMGRALGVDFSHTWSCYRGGEKACGTCPTCVERLNAFAQAGSVDPLPYFELLT